MSTISGEDHKELKGLKIEDFPNAAAVLLRVFLELSIDYYLDARGISITFKNDHNQKIEKTLKRSLRK